MVPVTTVEGSTYPSGTLLLDTLVTLLLDFVSSTLELEEGLTGAVEGSPPPTSLFR